jgi:hypothetical protein
VRIGRPISPHPRTGTPLVSAPTGARWAALGTGPERSSSTPSGQGRVASRVDAH